RSYQHSLVRRMAICDPGHCRAQQFDVYKWDANLKRVRHTRPIGITEKLVSHVPTGFQAGDRGTRRTDLIEVVLDCSDRPQFPPACSREVRVENLGQFPGHKQPSAQQVSAGITSAVLEKTRILW